MYCVSGKTARVKSVPPDDDEPQTLFEQVWLPLQVPQVRVPLQPSGILPQFFPWAAQVVGVQVVVVVHLPLALQVELPEHVPQVNVPLQPSDQDPQL